MHASNRATTSTTSTAPSRAVPGADRPLTATCPTLGTVSITTAIVEWATFPAGESFRRRSPIRSLGALLRVLRLAIAKRPVLLLHLHQADDDVLATKPHCFVESVGQCLIEGSLDVDASPLIECHLDQDRFLAPLNAEIGGIDHEFAL